MLAMATDAQDVARPRPVDPAAWGGDHVGQPFPPYVTGDECLFCHRDIGPTWGDNAHQRTIRPATPDELSLAALREFPRGKDLADQTQYLLGSERMTRFLKRSEEYGKLDLLSAMFRPQQNADVETDEASRENAPGEIHLPADDDEPRWEPHTFADRCAGCHTTAVDSRGKAFSSLSLDCFTCHGDVPLEHTKDTSLALLSAKHREPRQVISLCGQCHLRGGRSKSTGLPYPNTFVAGDNLFRDFQVDFSDEGLNTLPAADRHIFENTRDVALFNQTEMTCLTCHDVHTSSSERHQALEEVTICGSCHIPGTESRELREGISESAKFHVHSRVCGY